MKTLISFLLLLSAESTLALNSKQAQDEIANLYKNQSRETIITRIKNVKDEHQFLRSFTPYFYKRGFELKDALPIYARLKSYSGQIAGDAHVENFGFLVNNQETPQFTLNDFDDVAIAPLFLDVLRLSVSAAYVGNMDQGKMIEAYRKGLQNSGKTLSAYLQKVKKKSLKGGSKSKAKYKKTSNGFRFSKQSRPSFSTTVKEQNEMYSVLNQKYKNVKLHDSYRTMKTSGGSAFGIRYHALIELNDKVHLVEFKEIQEGGVVGNWIKNPVSDEQRVKTAMTTFLGQGFIEYLDVVKLNGKPFQLRFKLKGIKSVNFDKVKTSEVASVVEDEFYLLGQLHRLSIDKNSIEAYLQDLDKVKTSDWNESVKILKQEMSKIYISLGPGG